MLQDTDLIVPWLAINISGQWLLVVLLATYACAAWLPQRNNPYLINFVLTTFIASIPPSLLLYSGLLYSPVPSRLCMTQASLVTAVPPMFAVGQLALVFDTWSELRSICVHTTQFSRKTFVKCVALIAPYMAFGVWIISAFQTTLSSSLNRPGPLPPAGYVYCRANGKPAANLGTTTGFFIVSLTAIQVLFEVWVAWMIYAYPSKVHDDPKTWQTNIQFSLRVIILSMLQFITVFLNVLNSNTTLQNENVKRAFELLSSMNAIIAFLAVGAQTNVLLAWRYALLRAWDIVTRKKPENPDELQPQGFPVLDWAYVPSNSYREPGTSYRPQPVKDEERGVAAARVDAPPPTFWSRLKIGRRR